MTGQEKLNAAVVKFEENFGEILEAKTWIHKPNIVAEAFALTNGGVKEEGKAFPGYPGLEYESEDAAIKSFIKRLNEHGKDGNRLIWRDRPIFDSFEACKICNVSHKDGINPWTKEEITDHEWNPEQIFTIYSRFKVERV